MKSILFTLLFLLNNSIDNYLKNEYQDHVTISGIFLGKNTIDDVIKKFGKAKPFKIENCHHCEGVCYYLNKKDDKQAILFYRNPIDDLLGFKLFYLNDKNCYEKYCSINRKKILITKSGLYLGMKQDNFIKILGDPNYIKENEYIYQIHNNIQMPGKIEEFDDVITIKALFENKTLKVLDVTRTITY